MASDAQVQKSITKNGLQILIAAAEKREVAVATVRILHLWRCSFDFEAAHSLIFEQM